MSVSVYVSECVCVCVRVGEKGNKDLCYLADDRLESALGHSVPACAGFYLVICKPQASLIACLLRSTSAFVRERKRERDVPAAFISRLLSVSSLLEKRERERERERERCIEKQLCSVCVCVLRRRRELVALAHGPKVRVRRSNSSS